MTNYVNPFTGQTLSPSQVGYLQLTLTSTITTLHWPVNGNSTTTVAANIIQVTATTTGLSLQLPSALQVSTGQALVVVNIGSNPFTVIDANGGTIISIASGVSQYIYLTDNTTTQGTWSTLTFGAGTSSANASALAGAGLTASGALLNQSYPVNNVYSSITIPSSDRAQFLVWQGGAGALTLPPSSIGNNWFCMIRNSGTGTLTIQPQGSDTIDANSNAQLQISESFVIVCNGSTGFNTYGYGQSALFVFSQLALSVTGGTLALTAAQAGNLIQEYSGTLTSNQTIVMPPIVQFYSITNNTSGNFTFTVTTGSGTTVQVPSGSSLLIVCDGTNCYNATSGTAGGNTFTTISLGSGTLTAPSLHFQSETNTGVYLPTGGQLAFVVGGTLVGYFNATNFTALGGIGGGAF